MKTEPQDLVTAARELLETHSIVAMRVGKPYKEIRPLIVGLCDEVERLRDAHYLLFNPCRDGEHSDCIEYSNGLRRDAQLTRCSCPCHRPELPEQMERDVMIETIGELGRERDAAATRMREACVEKVKAKRDQRRKDLHALANDDNHEGEADYARAVLFVLDNIIYELESLTLDQVEQKQS